MKDIIVCKTAVGVYVWYGIGAKNKRKEATPTHNHGRTTRKFIGGVISMKRLTAIDTVALVLLIVGGLNWGLVGAFKFDLVAAIFGEDSALSRLVYILVGLSAVYTIYLLTMLLAPATHNTNATT